MRRIRLLVVDDSPFILAVIRKVLENDPDIEVVGEAVGGKAALAMARSLAPDVVTMDVRMPDMDGVAATRAIMADSPVPVIMVSSLTREGAETTLAAMDAGAVDFIAKAATGVQTDMARFSKELKEKIRWWGRRRPGARPPAAVTTATPASRRAERPARLDLVVVGVSTGGPVALRVLLSSMGRLRTPVVIAQHMPAFFTGPLAKTMETDTGLDVHEGADGMAITPGTVTVLPGARDSLVERRNGSRLLAPGKDAEALVHPSADLLFESAAKAADGVVAVILTGMGRDGTRGAKAVAERGWPVVVQEPQTCVVGAMPQSAIDGGLASHVLPVEEIGRLLAQWDHGG